ncbi:glycerophosphodiester phosphodiesterase [Kytococcus sp. HMSC28H12]|uniref:glycerophosphodiester phosphodiesterase n=2 Tax=Kytococcus TaxID=57499 RepID=UPI0009F5F2B4|nr:glycerophosphodiester phosphodiesterase [Kytococcus sp. HMSC28H12]
MAATRHLFPEDPAPAARIPSPGGADAGDTRTPYLAGDGPLVLAHRGFAPDGSENSMAAFDAAVALGCTYVETDVHATADGVVVAFHDDTLDRVTDATGRIADLPWEQVRRARITGGHPVPTLEELLTRHPGLRLNVDLKSDGAVEPTVALVERLGVHDRVLLTSFDDARRQRALDLLSRPVATSAGQARTAAMWAASRLLVLAAGIGVGTAELARGRLAAPGRHLATAAEEWTHRLVRRVAHDIDAYQVPEHFRGLRVVDHAFLDAAHLAGAQVHVWTVNEEADMRRLLDLGVDGLVTDRADRALAVVSGRS